MRFSFSGTRLPELAALQLAMLAATSATAATTPCALVAPEVQTAAGRVQFGITLDCGAQVHAAKPFPADTQVLIGLTLYAGSNVTSTPFDSADNFQGRTLDSPDEIRAALGHNTRSKATGAAGAAKWIVLNDESVRSYDVTPKTVHVSPQGGRTKLRFDVTEKDIVGTQHFVFAAWSVAQRVACKKKDEYARSGCKRDGYVLGSDGVNPLGAYPGIEINRFQHPSGAAWTSERWIAERFR